MIPMPAGSTIKRYKTVVTRGAKQAAEGDIVPLSKVERKPLEPIELKLDPHRRLTTAQAIQRVGAPRALNEADAALVGEIRTDVNTAFFDLITAETAQTVPGGANLQSACAQGWGKLASYYDNKDVTPIFFVSPLDVADYLGSAVISTQTAFGVKYLENFLGLGTAIITPKVAKGAVYCTAEENLNGAYVPQGGDVADAFGLHYDETGLVGVTHSRADDRASIQTLIMLGVVLYPEDASGIFKATIGA